MPRCSDGSWCIDDLCHFTSRTLCGIYEDEYDDRGEFSLEGTDDDWDDYGEWLDPWEGEG